jgi:type IV pilus assembly protein PilB
MSAVKKPLGELLVKENLVSIQQLEEARKEQKANGGRLGSALVRLGHVRDKEMAEFLGRQYDMSTVDLEQFEIDQDALKAIPREVCEKHMIIPVSKSGNILVVAFADPTNMYVRDDIALLSRCKIEVVVAPETVIVRAIEKYYVKKSTSDMSSLASEMEFSDEALNFTQSLQAQLIGDVEGDDQAGIVKLVNTMLTEAIKAKASDIHIEPYEKRLRIRFRVDGTLIEKVQPPAGIANALSSRLKIMSRLDIAERRKPQDGRLKAKTANGMEVDFRVSVLPTLFGEKIVMRLLDKSNLKLDMTKLGFEEEEMNLFKLRINDPQGLVLVTGPTGSGKTTTLYSALWSLNDPQINISTAEDPVEFNLDGINQVQVNPKVGFGFADALRSFLRQDPDVILVGEIRDLETAEVAFKAASTGHLVLSTLHTNDAPSTVSRLIDMGVAPYLITSTVSIIIAQRLAGRICEKCKIPEKVLPEALLSAGVSKEDIGTFECMRGEGCSACNGTGIKGRVAIYELMEMSNPLKEEILRGGSPVEIKKGAIAGGTKTLRQAAIQKLKAGTVSLDGVLNVTIADDKI